MPRLFSYLTLTSADVLGIVKGCRILT